MDPVDRSFPFHGYLQTFNKKEKITDEKAPPMLNVLKFWITYVFFKEKRRLIQKLERTVEPVEPSSWLSDGYLLTN